MLNRKDDKSTAVIIGNPRSADFEVGLFCHLRFVYHMRFYMDCNFLRKWKEATSICLAISIKNKYEIKFMLHENRKWEKMSVLRGKHEKEI